MFGLAIKACSFSSSPSRPPTKRQELAVFPAVNITAALLYHISLLLCQVQPHKPPPAPPPAVALTHQSYWTMPTIELMPLIDSWNLLILKPVAMVTAQYDTYVHIHEWKYIFSRICERTVESLCVTGLWSSWKTLETCRCLEADSHVRLPFPGPLHEWYLPWEVIISRSWTNELTYFTSGNALNISPHFCSSLFLKFKGIVPKIDSFTNVRH